MPASDENQKRLEAFLALIRYAENNNQERSDSYTRLNGGGHFGSFSTHPKKGVPDPHHGSTAAGAYQITVPTYNDAVKGLVVHDFSERSQDLIALWRITHRGAKGAIEDGNLDAAFAALNLTWSSLPGEGQQKLTSDEAKQYFWGRLGEVPP